MKNIKFLVFLNKLRSNDFFSGGHLVKWPILMGALLLGLLPLLVSIFCCLHFYQELKISRTAIEEIHQQLYRTEIVSKRKHAYLARYGNYDPYFLDQLGESLSFLQDERRFLETFLKYQALRNCNMMHHRLEFLRNQNRLRFSEESHIHTSHFEETYLQQIQPVEVDFNDLKKILACLEGVEFVDEEQAGDQRPQIIIKECRISGKNTSDYRDPLLLQTKLIKRGIQ